MSELLTWDFFPEERARLGRPFVIGHRGAPLVEAENGLASFARALEEGADVLETDLRFSADGEIVLFHDATLARTTGAAGEVGERTLAELKQLRLIPPPGGRDDQSIPTLVELIAMTQARVPLLLELKDPLFLQPAYAARLVDILRAYNMIERSALISFHEPHVRSVQALEPQMRTGHITMRNALPRRDVQLQGPVWPLLFLNPAYVRLAHRQGRIVAPLDPRPESRLWYYVWLNVDALLADDPAAVLQALKKAGQG